MMQLRYLRNDRGVTLIELVVALAISSILLVSMVSASIFVQKFVSNWQKKDSLAEELAFVRQELAPRIASAKQIGMSQDSLMVLGSDRRLTVYTWHGGMLRAGGRSLLGPAFHLDSLAVSRIVLRNYDPSPILKQAPSPQRSGLFELFIVLSSHKGQRDSLRVIVRNDYEYHTYRVHEKTAQQ
jgi:prepilin-type N-terminal cleavage/methylation domain-containing protein